MTAAGPQRARSWWGWGRVDRALADDECAELGALLPGLPDRPRPVPHPGELAMPAARVRPPASLGVSTTPEDRAAHTYGKAYRDVVRALSGDVHGAPDGVLFPASEAEIAEVLDWAGSAGVAVVPYGGGSSVVGGVEYRGDGPWVSLDLARLDRVLELDPVSRAARIQAGVFGPALEEQLRPSGLTLRHFPQSFEFSTLGGWLATRAGGHYATLYTHIDDLVESLRVVTPSGVSESRRLPASGAGPSPDRLFLGSEGALGVIVEAWVRLQERPRFKASTAVTFPSMAAAIDAVRTISQAGLHPANCRLLDPGEAALSGIAGQGRAVLILGVESAVVPVADRLAQLVDLAREGGGTPEPPSAGKSDGAAAAWRSSFLRAPYVRDGLARMSGIVETFETACTWDRVGQLYESVRAEVGAAVESVTGAPGLVNCRFTHVYPDGAAPYFTVIAIGRPGAEVAMWDEIKVAASEVLARLGATITHHHAVGRDHRPWYDRQRPGPFGAALRAVKATLDPHGVLNPGVLIDAAT
jgi:alkyldihydroxyacetonephosphate synthase